MTKRTLRILILAIVAFAAGLLIARGLATGPSRAPRTERATVLDAPRALPPLTLVDQDGRPLGPDYFRGHWTLVFFGYTSCPDVCPTTLAMLVNVAKALRDLPQAERPRVLFVSVDPERDDPARLAAYVRFFDPAFEGATGDAAAVAAAAGAFGVPYLKVPVPGGAYNMDHGTGIFLVGPGGRLVAYSSAPHDAATLARDYRSIVLSNGATS
ncbi:MAG: SCO family protein [Steroidobacteraceae bacterium]